MSLREPYVEANLRRAAFRWKALRLLQHTATIGAAFCLALTLLGVAMVRGWLVETSSAVGWITLLAVSGLIVWAVLAIRLRAKAPDRRWLAGALEASDGRLLDRLNTLVFLEKGARREGPAKWFFPRIAKQTRGLLVAKQPPAPFSAAQPLVHLGVFIVLLTATIYFYDRFSPWQRLLASQETRRAQAAPRATAPEIALPTNNVAEENKLWGEVRITDPARDLKVTKVDVVPLQIEAAANQSLKRVGWFSTINGGTEKLHELPAPPEPRYAVYQPMVYLDEFRLADWDVLTYYANARTAHGEGYASEVYFIEVRPFREDILKLPGGEGGKAYQALSEMTSLIERQQHVIRETHRYQQSPQDQAKLREQDRRKLSEAEDDLSASTRHLYAEMAAEMENKPIGEALDHLAQAARTLDDAGKSLAKDVIPEAQNSERSALADLIAARKMYQKAVSDNPKDFADEQDKKDDEPSPVAEPSKKLSEIAEFRNEAKASQDFVRNAVEQQKKLAKRAATTARNQQPQLGEEEDKLRKSLQDFEAQHPQVFHDVTNETQSADQSLAGAADSLQKKTGNAPIKAETASADLEKLASAMENKTAGRQLADAYRLKQLLDQQIQKLNQMQQSTNEPTGEDLKKTAENSRETLSQLKQVAENKPTSDAFGPQLKDSLSGTNKSNLDQQLDQLEQASGNSAKKDAAGQAKQSLAKVSESFNQSQPSATQAARKHDSLKPEQQEAFERGMAQLESLKQQMANGHAIPADQEAKQRQEAFQNLKDGLLEQYGNDPHAKDVVALLEKDLLDRPNPLDMVLLKKLMDELRMFSIEVADKKEKSEKPEMTNIDPSRLPPAYRGRIEKYYQKLSEQKR